MTLVLPVLNMKFFCPAALASCFLASLFCHHFAAHARPTSPCDVTHTDSSVVNDTVTKPPLLPVTHLRNNGPSNTPRTVDVNDVSDDAGSCDQYSTRVLISLTLVRNAVNIAFSKACSTLCSHYPNKCKSLTNFCDVIKERASNTVYIPEWPQDKPITSFMPAVGHILDLLACLEIGEKDVSQAPMSYRHQISASFNRTRTEMSGLNIAKDELVICLNLPSPVGQCKSNVTLTDQRDPYQAVIHGLYILVWVSNDMTTMIQQATK